MDRVAIKAEARAKIKGNLWTIWKAFLIVMLVSFVANSIISAAFPATLSTDALKVYFETGALPAGYRTNQIISSVLNVLLMPLTIGTIAYVLKFIRGEEPEIKDIFGFYKNILPIFAVSLLVGIFVGVGTVLFVIPGIIIALMLHQNQKIDFFLF